MGSEGQERAGHPSQSHPDAFVPRGVSALMRYEFRVSGVVPDTLAANFPELARIPVREQTLLHGSVADEAHLYGLLTRFQSLGLRVLEMRQLPA